MIGKWPSPPCPINVAQKMCVMLVVLLLWSGAFKWIVLGRGSLCCDHNKYIKNAEAFEKKMPGNGWYNWYLGASTEMLSVRVDQLCAEPCKHFSFTCRGAVWLVPCRIRSCTGLRSVARGFVPWLFLVWALLSFPLSVGSDALPSVPPGPARSSWVCAGTGRTALHQAAFVQEGSLIPPGCLCSLEGSTCTEAPHCTSAQLQAALTQSASSDPYALGMFSVGQKRKHGKLPLLKPRH